VKIDGYWQPAIDNPQMLRPVVEAKVITPSDVHTTWFMIDTGADRTVLGSIFADALKAYQKGDDQMLVSAGGIIQSYTADLQIVLPDIEGRGIRFNLQGIVLTDPYQANTHLLGRDILNYFAVICDHEANLVTLLRAPHRYQINN
jgi:hypothetical protein